MEKILYSPEPAKARIEIIPLIDVVFFLLATYVLFTLSLNKIKSLETPLPKPRDQPGETDGVFIQATAHRTFYWKQGSKGIAEPIPATEIPARLAEYKLRTSAPSVFVRGDNEATFGPAVFILDEARKAGITQVSIETVTSASGK